MRGMWLLTWIALAGLAGCAGEAVPRADGQPAAADSGAGGESPVFAPQPDVDLPANVPPEPDAALPYKDCSKWSAWTCQEIPVMLCKATCATPTKTYSVSCLKKGGCVCGLSTGLCGPYSYAQPCDACRKAFEQGCCEK
jgi:hypothetical protein